jgi:Rrf2 family protein
MIFSKSFGYALRGILYVALEEVHQSVQLDDMAEALGVPRHFMAKIMKRLVQRGLLSSAKGRFGGFSLSETTLQRKLIDIYEITDHPEALLQCVLSKGLCSAEHPCRLHDKIAPLRQPLQDILYHTTIGDLLYGGNKEELLGSLTSNVKSD